MWRVYQAPPVICGPTLVPLVVCRRGRLRLFFFRSSGESVDGFKPAVVVWNEKDWLLETEVTVLTVASDQFAGTPTSSRPFIVSR